MFVEQPLVLPRSATYGEGDPGKNEQKGKNNKEIDLTKRQYNFEVGEFTLNK